MFSTYFKNNITICTLHDLLYLSRIPSIPIQEGEYSFKNSSVYNYYWINKNIKNNIYDQLVTIPLLHSLWTTNLNEYLSLSKITTLLSIKKYLTGIDNIYKPILYSPYKNTDINFYNQKKQLKNIKNNFIVFFLNNLDSDLDITLIKFGKKNKIGLQYIHEVIYKNEQIGYVIVSQTELNNFNEEKNLILHIDNNKHVFGFGFINLNYIRALNIYPNIDIKKFCDDNTIAFIKYSPIEHKPKKFILTADEISNKFTINNKKFDVFDKNQLKINYRKYFQFMNKNLYKKLFANNCYSNKSCINISFDLFKDTYNIHVIGKMKDEFTFQSKDIIKERNSIFSKFENKAYSHIQLLNDNAQFIFVMLMPFSDYTNNYELYDEFDLTKTSIIYLNFVTHFKKEILSRVVTAQKYLSNFIKYLLIKEYTIIYNKKSETEHICILTNKTDLDILEVYDKYNINTGIKIISSKL